MVKKSISRSWEEFIKFAETLTGPAKRAADMAVRSYKGSITNRVKHLAQSAGFEFEETVREFTPDETRWIEIFNELESLDYEAKMLSDDSEANADVVGAIAGIYADDGSIAKRLGEIAERKAALEAERKMLWEVEEELYPQPVAYGLPRVKVWLA